VFDFLSDPGVDLSRLRITFTDVEKYAAAATGCESTAKAYKYFAEPGYLHKIKSKCTGK
jgi:hypothetical protein